MRLMHEVPVALYAVPSCASRRLGGLADQHVVGSWSGAGTDAEEGIECGMACPAPIEAEHELIQIVLEVRLAQPMVNAEAPALEV